MKRPPAFIYLAALIGFTAGGLAYIFVIRHLFFRGGLALSFSIMIVVTMLIMNMLAKNVTVYLDEKSLFIDGARYLRHEISTIQTYDYNQGDRTRIYFRIQLKEGHILHIVDTRLFEGKDQAQTLRLQKLLNAMKTRLNIDVIKQNSWSGLVSYAVKP